MDGDVAAYRIAVHREGESYRAEVQELPGCTASADTMGGLWTAVADAMSVYLSTEAVHVTVSVGDPKIDQSVEFFDATVRVQSGSRPPTSPATP